MTLEASVLGDHAVRRVSHGYEVEVHLPWYRSLALSCLEDMSIDVGGVSAARDILRVLRDERELQIEELADLVDQEWFVQDPITVFMPSSAPLESGSIADVRVWLAMRIPYIIIGPQTALIQRTQVQRRAVIQ